MLEIGSIVDGKYKILNKIGQGGMSVVYLAMNERANKQWAIKEIRKDGTSNYEVVKQGLIVETDLLKRLSHPHLPSIIDVIDGEGTFLIVMDYIEGNPLSKILKRQGAQSQEDVIEWAKQLCDVLGYLHSRQPPIVYRDMKPSNVMLKPDGNVTLIDFGTAREFKSSSVADTTCLGTQGYAAPEQFGGHGQTDGRTDIYCLGATMYHLVTGHNPAEPPYEMYPIRQWNPKLSSGLEAIILKCTQKNPNDRYQSCAELMYALEHYKDLEIESRREYTEKWRLFLGSAIACGVFAASAVGFKVFANSQIRSTYDYYIQQGTEANSGGDYEAAITNFSNAIELAPENSEAYSKLLNEVILKDNVFSAEENATFSTLLAGTGSDVNEELLRNNDEAAYDELAYDLGDAYYYFYYDTEEGRQKAGKWYSIAAQSAVLDDRRKTVASTLEKIIDYTDALKSATIRPNGERQVSYQQFWDDLNTLINIDYESMGSRIVSVKVYQNFNSSVYADRQNFLNEGITNQQILDGLRTVRDKMRMVMGYEENTSSALLPASVKGDLEKAITSVESNISELEKTIAQGNK